MYMCTFNIRFRPPCKVAGVLFRSGSGTFPANLNLDLTDNVLCR